MKVQIYAGALAAACDKAIEARQKWLDDARQETVDKALLPYRVQPTYRREKTGIWPFQTLRTVEIPSPELQRTPAEAKAFAEAAWSQFNYGPPQGTLRLRDIAKHKNPNTLLELTDQELEGISQYLAPYDNSEGRI